MLPLFFTTPRATTRKNRSDNSRKIVTTARDSSFPQYVSFLPISACTCYKPVSQKRAGWCNLDSSSFVTGRQTKSIEGDCSGLSEAEARKLRLFTWLRLCLVILPFDVSAADTHSSRTAHAPARRRLGVGGQRFRRIGAPSSVAAGARTGRPRLTAMKFGKRILAQLLPEWRASYVDYKLLKKEIKEWAAKLSAGDAEAGARHAQTAVEAFLRLLQAQLAMVEAFYAQQEEALVAQWKVLSPQLEPERGGSGGCCGGGASASASGGGGGVAAAAGEQGGASAAAGARAARGAAAGIAAAAGVGAAAGGAHAAAAAGPTDRQAEFGQLYDKAQRLRHYVALNYMAFVKGMKKFEKKTQLLVTGAFLPSMQTARFYTCPYLGDILGELDEVRSNPCCGSCCGPCACCVPCVLLVPTARALLCC